jgi:porphobilinogen synthase
VNEKISARRAIGSMPGVAQLAPNEGRCRGRTRRRRRFQAIMLFGIRPRKTSAPPGPMPTNGVVKRRCGAIKREAPDLLVLTDVCLLRYMSHGHCGVIAGWRTFSMS